jgi:hypothetical protein
MSKLSRRVARGASWIDGGKSQQQLVDLHQFVKHGAKSLRLV